MATVLENKHIILGVTGSIAAYKALDLASRLVRGGAIVDAVLTANATRFVAPLSFSAITHRPTTTDLFDPASEIAMDHIALAREADAVIVAPATANTVSKLARGAADDALTTTILATRAPLIVAPAGDARMFENPATQANLALLKQRGVRVVGPEKGRLASGAVGFGRLAAPWALVEHLRQVLGRNGDYAGRSVVVSAGGTREPIDPVRVLANRSSGKMGYAVARAARDRGARVTLISAPASLRKPVGVSLVQVETAAEMRDAVVSAAPNADLLIMAAAVADYRPESSAPGKIKREARDSWSLRLVRTPDIIAEAAGPRLVKVAFAAEVSDVVQNARSKLAAKGASLIVANDVSAPDSGFGSDTNRASILGANGEVEHLPLMDKFDVAQRILDRALPFLAGEGGT